MRIDNSFDFARGEVPLCCIRIHSRSGDGDLHCASILATAVAEISGARIDIVEWGGPTTAAGEVLIGTLHDGAYLERALLEQGVLASREAVREKGHVRALTAGDLGEEGFIVHRPTDGQSRWKHCLIAAGATPQGAMYAASALADRLHEEDGHLIVDGLGTRLMPPVNLPAFRHRSIFTGLGGADWLGPDQYTREFGQDYRAFVDWLAQRRYNHLLVHNFANLCWGVNYRSAAFPELVNPHHPNVQHEFMGDLIRYAHQRGIQVMFGADLPDNWSGVLRAHPDWAGANVDWSCFPQGGDWDAFASGQGDWRYAWFEVAADGRRTFCGGRGREVRKRASWVCLSHPEVMAFWRAYWEEVLDTYPEVDGIGGQFSEHLYCCDCEECTRAGFPALAARYYDAMEEIARRRHPPRRTWIWTVPGARDIMAHRERHPDLTVIDWGLGFEPFAMGQVVPKSDWYLCHGSGRISDFGMREYCRSFSSRGLQGVQVRAVDYRQADRYFRGFSEFMWDPRLSVDEYAHLQTIGQLRRKDPDVTAAYAHLIRAQGYLELLQYESPCSDAWARREGVQGRYEEERKQLREALEKTGGDHPFMLWLEGQTELLESAAASSGIVQ